MLAYPPAMWTSDSLRYVTLATHLIPYQIQPVGYSVMLTLLAPFHSLALVAGIQHAMGLAMGTLVYVLLRHRFRFTPLAATAAAIPPLLSAYAIQIEHFLLSDTLFGLLVTITVVLVLWRPMPGLRLCVVVGMLLAADVLVRSQGLLLAIPVCLYLAIRFVARRAVKRAVVCILALSMTLGLPLLGYAWWFERTNGAFQVTTSTGAYLYGRVTTFAECSVINPPADERWLCLSVPVSKREYPGYYVWAPNSPLAHAPGWEFGEVANRLATNFALRAIEAQPLDYLRAVWHSTYESFRLHRDPIGSGQSQDWYKFPGVTPQSVSSLADATNYSYRAVYSYDQGDPSTRVVQPYAAWIRTYQRFIVIPGPLLGVIVIVGLVGIALAWRRFGGAGLLPWLTGVILIVTPAAGADFDARYLVASVPVFCIAAGIGVKEISAHINDIGKEHLPESENELANAVDIYLA